MSALAVLSDRELLKVYHKVQVIDVEQDFIDIVNEELKRRGIRTGKTSCSSVKPLKNSFCSIGS